MIADLLGKAVHMRTVPISQWVRQRSKNGRSQRHPGRCAVTLRERRTTIPGWLRVTRHLATSQECFGTRII